MAGFSVVVVSPGLAVVVPELDEEDEDELELDPELDDDEPDPEPDEDVPAFSQGREMGPFVVGGLVAGDVVGRW